jgi:hypothetical protein
MTELAVYRKSGETAERIQLPEDWRAIVIEINETPLCSIRHEEIQQRREGVRIFPLYQMESEYMVRMLLK